MVDDLVARAAFLWGDDVDEADWDLDHEDGLDEFLDEASGDLEGIGAAVRQVLGRQLLTDSEPAVWKTVLRLRDAGLDDRSILGQLSLTLAEVIHRVVDEASPFDPDAYRSALAALPLPGAGRTTDTIIGIVRAEPWIGIDDALERAVAELDPDGSDLVRLFVEQVFDRLTDRSGPLALGPDDTVVHVPSLLDAAVLTHRLSEVEIEITALAASVDLAPLRHHDDGLADAEGRHLHSTAGEDRVLLIDLTEELLAGCSPGDLVGVRVDEDGTLRVERLAEEPPLGDELVEWVRAACEREIETIGLPADAADLVVGLLHDHPGLFDTPRPPLSELAVAAGLKIHTDLVAPDGDRSWWRAYRLDRTRRVFEEVDDPDRAREVLAVLALADVCDSWEVGDDRVARAEDALAALDDPHTLTAIANALLFPTDPALPSTDPGGLLRELEAAARTGRERGAVGWMRAVCHERLGELAEAEAALVAAHRADPDSAVLVDRLAWYASDRGDAAEAARLWRQVSADDVVAADLRNVEWAAAFGSRTVGRNEPCWCGSGRKYKQCHLGATTLPPLPERVGWLCRKAVAFVERRGGEVQAELIELARARSVDPEDQRQVVRSFEDPLLMDLLLTEQGWFESFLHERGALLPSDELLLAQSWLLVPRTVYEVTGVRAGDGVEVRDLRSGELTWVSEQSFSRSASVGEMICARAVPDGEGHQFIGGVFAVRAGTEADLLDLLDDGDGFVIAEWVADSERGPVVVDRHGEPLLNLRNRSMIDLAAEARERGGPPAGIVDVDDPEIAGFIARRRDEMERQWCDEEVPALGGLTPRAAAADPTRRESLIRLLDEFDRMPLPEGAFGFRPWRLRELLGIDPRPRG